MTSFDYDPLTKSRRLRSLRPFEPVESPRRSGCPILQNDVSSHTFRWQAWLKTNEVSLERPGPRFTNPLLGLVAW